MILSTMNDLPGYEVTEVIGEVFGITVRARNVGSQIGAGFKSLVGGELRGMTKLLSASRVEAQDRLIEVGAAKGADAILAMRFDVNELGGIGQEICAYGTAVKIRRADFKTYTRQCPLEPPTQDTAAVSAAAKTLLEGWLAAQPNAAVRLLGVGVSSLQAVQQGDLFPGPAAQASRLDSAIDGIRGRFGSAILTRASLLPSNRSGSGSGG